MQNCELGGDKGQSVCILAALVRDENVADSVITSADSTSAIRSSSPKMFCAHFVVTIEKRCKMRAS